MSGNLKFIEKILKSRIYVVNGLSYDFESVERDPEMDETYRLKVLATLPKTEHSYSVKNMLDDIDGIVQRVSDYLGETFSYRVNLDLNSEGVNDGRPIYIDPKYVDQIYEEFNKRLSPYKIKTKLGEEYIFDISFVSPKKFVKRGVEYIQETNDDNIEFYVYLIISNFRKVTPEGEIKLQPEMEVIDNLAAAIKNSLIEDEFLHSLENVVYMVLETPLNLNKYETYVSTNFALYKIDGVKVDDSNWGIDHITDDLFKEKSLK